MPTNEKIGGASEAQCRVRHAWVTARWVVRRAHATVLNITDEWLFPWWLGVHDNQCSDRLLALGAIGAYATYRATNAARHQGGFSSADGERALQQSIREAVGGHARAERVVADVWRDRLGARR